MDDIQLSVLSHHFFGKTRWPYHSWLNPLWRPFPIICSCVLYHFFTCGKVCCFPNTRQATMACDMIHNSSAISINYGWLEMRDVFTVWCFVDDQQYLITGIGNCWWFYVSIAWNLFLSSLGIFKGTLLNVMCFDSHFTEIFTGVHVGNKLSLVQVMAWSQVMAWRRTQEPMINQVTIFD